MSNRDGGEPRVSRRALAHAIVLLAGGLILGGPMHAGGRLEVAKVTSAPNTSGIILNHKFKTETVGIGCDVCHELNAANTRFMTFPTHETCAACHADQVDANSENKNCGMCHTLQGEKTYVRKNVVLSPLVSFDHKLHLDAKVSCERCHTVTDSNIRLNDEMLPKMDTCVKCHAQRNPKAASDCLSCHVKGFEKVAPAWDSRPKDHTPLWVTNHGKGLTQATIDSTCSLCHTAASGNDCITCHKRSDPPSTHTTAWKLAGHGSRAKVDRQSCATCHDQSECVSCHTTNEPFSHTGLWGTPNDRHCLTCHFTGQSFVSGDLGGNCSFCHVDSVVYGKHRGLQKPGHYSGSDCTTCHLISGGAGPNIRHPYPPDAAKCASCHQ